MHESNSAKNTRTARAILPYVLLFFAGLVLVGLVVWNVDKDGDPTAAQELLDNN